MHIWMGQVALTGDVLGTHRAVYIFVTSFENEEEEEYQMMFVVFKEFEVFVRVFLPVSKIGMEGWYGLSTF